MLRHDYIKRLIEQLAQTLAAALGLGRNGQNEQAFQMLYKAYEGLGVGRGFLNLEAHSLARILSDPERIEAVAKVSEAEAELLELGGSGVAARACRERARQLRETLPTTP